MQATWNITAVYANVATSNYIHLCSGWRTLGNSIWAFSILEFNFNRISIKISNTSIVQIYQASDVYTYYTLEC